MHITGGVWGQAGVERIYPFGFHKLVDALTMEARTYRKKINTQKV